MKHLLLIRVVRSRVVRSIVTILLAVGLVRSALAQQNSEGGMLALQPSAMGIQAKLKFPQPAPGHYGIRLEWNRQGQPVTVFRQEAPLAIEVVDRSGTASWITGAYTQVTPSDKAVSCTGAVSSPNGTRFEFTDIYRQEAPQNRFLLSRTVRVAAMNLNDVAFASRFSLTSSAPMSVGNCDFFVPGIWYKNNAHVPPTALASHLDDRFFYFREDRLPFPLTMLRNRGTGAALTLSHVEGTPTTIANEDGLNRLIDERMQFGALGFVNSDHLETAFLFPGTEGERTYLYGASLQKNRWAYRSHPVREGFTHAYKLTIAPGWAADFPSSVQQSWSAARGQTKSIPTKVDQVKVNQEKVYKDGMDLLAIYCQRYHGVISMPFQARVPTGEVIDTSSQMGFVGAALPAAALLLRYGLEQKNEGIVTRASDLIDHWAMHSMTPSGVPRTWYDIHPDGSFTWRSYPTYLRVASDGLDGVLHAYDLMRRHNRIKPEWLKFCTRYGDWLLSMQNSDGSYHRAYDFEGHPTDRSTDTTDHPIEFLVDLYKATGKPDYLATAIRAGNYCWRSVHEAYAYVGGTPDNPNVTDKEGGMMALNAFLALYDGTGDKRWLRAAEQAAWYCDTWVYLWNIPMPTDDPKIIFPKGRSTSGLSLIATGHSGADNFMASAPFSYYRLYLLTGQEQFRDAARRLLVETRQMLDSDGTLGYRYPGLLSEALTLAPLRGHGVQGWLPWLTVLMLAPLVHFKDVFGTTDIDQIDRQSPAERQRQETEYEKQRGFQIPQ